MVDEAAGESHVVASVAADVGAIGVTGKAEAEGAAVATVETEVEGKAGTADEGGVEAEVEVALDQGLNHDERTMLGYLILDNPTALRMSMCQLNGTAGLA